MPRAAVLVRGAGDLASGTALRLFRAGFPILLTEIEQPLAVRRTVAFSEAVYDGTVTVEGVRARLAPDAAAVPAILDEGEIPLLVDPALAVLEAAAVIEIPALVDARLLKQVVPRPAVNYVVGLGPGFVPGRNCDAAVETMRGHNLGRVYTGRAPEANTGLPDGDPQRVLRAPVGGVLTGLVQIGDQVTAGDPVAQISSGPGLVRTVPAPLAGVVRGMIRSGLAVEAGVKIGDIDPRGRPEYCRFVSDKALAVGGGVLEALMNRPELRRLAAA